MYDGLWKQPKELTPMELVRKCYKAPDGVVFQVQEFGKRSAEGWIASGAGLNFNKSTHKREPRIRAALIRYSRIQKRMKD